jgi:hypothetical protein
VGALEKAKASCEEDPDAYPEWPNAAWDAEGMIFTCEIYAELLDCHTFSHRPTLRRMVEQLKAIGFAIPERLVEKSKPLAPPRTGRRAAGSSRRLKPSMA